MLGSACSAADADADSLGGDVESGDCVSSVGWGVRSASCSRSSAICCNFRATSSADCRRSLVGSSSSRSARAASSKRPSASARASSREAESSSTGGCVDAPEALELPDGLAAALRSERLSSSNARARAEFSSSAWFASLVRSEAASPAAVRGSARPLVNSFSSSSRRSSSAESAAARSATGRSDCSGRTLRACAICAAMDCWASRVSIA